MKIVLVFCAVVTTFAYPQFPNQADEFLGAPPCSTCRLKQSENIDNIRFNFPQTEYYDPFKRYARYATQESSVFPDQETKDFSTYVQQEDPKQFPRSGLLLKNRRVMSEPSSSMLQDEPQITQFSEMVRSPAEVKMSAASIVAQTKNIPFVEDPNAQYAKNVRNSAEITMGESVLLKPVTDWGSLMAPKIRTEDLKLSNKHGQLHNNEFEHDCRMYYMQVQSLNLFDNYDEGKKIETKINDEKTKTKELPREEIEIQNEYGDITNVLQPLLAGQLAILAQQQQMEQSSNDAYKQQEKYLKEITRQLEQIKMYKEFFDRVPATEITDLTSSAKNLNSDTSYTATSTETLSFIEPKLDIVGTTTTKVPQL